MLREAAYGWETAINLKLTLPNGQKIERKVTLMNKPRETWIEIPVGEFKASFDEQKTNSSGDLEIYIHEYNAGDWKCGLVVKGIVIRAKNWCLSGRIFTLTVYQIQTLQSVCVSLEFTLYTRWMFDPVVRSFLLLW